MLTEVVEKITDPAQLAAGAQVTPDQIQAGVQLELSALNATEVVYHQTEKAHVEPPCVAPTVSRYTATRRANALPSPPTRGR